MNLPKKDIHPPIVRMKVLGNESRIIELNQNACTELSVDVALFNGQLKYRCSHDVIVYRDCVRYCGMRMIPQGQTFCPLFDQMKREFEQQVLVEEERNG